jgi:hypothetical protein
MGQSMKSQREFFLDSVLNEFPALARPAADYSQSPARGRSVGERLDRLRQLGIEATRQKVKQIEAMIADLESMARTLDVGIRAEEDQTGVRDAGHFAYSTCARAMTQRRDNLKRSIGELKRQLAGAKAALGEPHAPAFGPSAAVLT